MRLGDLKSEKSRVFQFKKGQNWDGDEKIFRYIEDLLLDETEAGNFPQVKQDTFITIHCAKRISKNSTITGQEFCKLVGLGCGVFVKKSKDFFYHCGDNGNLFCEECEKRRIDK